MSKKLATFLENYYNPPEPIPTKIIPYSFWAEDLNLPPPYIPGRPTGGGKKSI